MTRPEERAGWSRVTGIGHRLPDARVTNADLEQTLDTSDEWIVSRVGIRERRVARNETVSDLAAAAARDALAAAALDADAIDLVVVATMTAEDRCPSVAAMVARVLGCDSPACFDVNAACAGFSQALAIADQAIRAGDATRAVVIGAERMSDVLDWTDRSTAILMGDGAGAVVVERSETRGIWPVAWGADPRNSDLVRILAPSQRFEIEGPSVFRWAITNGQHVARLALERAGVSASEVALFVPHQANLRIVHALATQLDIPLARTAQDVVTSGNTSAASIPIALSRWTGEHGTSRDDLALLLGFGGGFSYSAQVIALPAIEPA